MNRFKRYMKDNYSPEELKEIVMHGCVSGCASTMIYYNDTRDLYNEYDQQLHEILDYEIEQFGEVPAYFKDNMGDVRLFKNAMVWFGAETMANELLIEHEIYV